jgi:hypothetical protein
MNALSLEPLAESDLDLIAEWFIYGLTDLLNKKDSLAAYKLEFKNIKTIVYPDALMGSIDGDRAFYIKGTNYSKNEYRVNLLLSPAIRSIRDLILIVWKEVLKQLANRFGSVEITTEIAQDDKITIEVLELLGFSLGEVVKSIRDIKYIYIKKI